MIQRYGFLYGGYSFPYWEVVDMVRKLAIAALPVFVKPQPTGSLQAVLGEVVMVIYIFVISYLKPFASPNDNLLQVGSMLGAVFATSNPLHECDLGPMAAACPTAHHQFDPPGCCRSCIRVILSQHTNRCALAVLFLLLLSGESLKWAKLSSTQEQYMSDAQVLLTTGVVVAVVLYGFLTLGFVRRGAKVNSPP